MRLWFFFFAIFAGLDLMIGIQFLAKGSVFWGSLGLGTALLASLLAVYCGLKETRK